MNPLTRFRDWWTDWLNREPIDLDAEDRKAFGLDGAPAAPPVDQMAKHFDTLPSHDERRVCGTAKDIAVGASWLCTLRAGHDGDHEARYPGPSHKLAHRWPDAESTPLFDAVQHQHETKRMATAAIDAHVRKDAAELEADLMARYEIGRDANRMHAAGDDAWEFALAGLLDDAEGTES